jgi:SOS-response transcriptional repressor LexA
MSVGVRMVVVLQNARTDVKHVRAKCKKGPVKPSKMSILLGKRADRLKAARAGAGFDTAEAACERFGWKLGTYGTHESGHRGFAAKAPEYADAFGVRLEWLMTGRGQKDTTAQGIKSTGGVLPKLHSDTQRVPLLGWGMINNAKSVQEAIKAPVTYVSVSTKKIFGAQAFELVVDDESMRDTRVPYAGFNPGDELIFDPDKVSKPGDLILARVDGEPTELFRLYRHAGKTADGEDKVELVPLNQSYGTTEFINGVDGAILARLEHCVKSFS